MIPARAALPVLALLVLSVPIAAVAQTAPTTAPVTLPHISESRTVWITEADGRETSGKVTYQTDTTIDIATRDGARRFRFRDLVKIEKKDSNWDGLAKGLTGGLIAMLGVAWHANSRHREPSDLTPYLLLGVGAAIGAWIDDAAEHREVIYEPSPKRGATVDIVPLVGLDRARRIGVSGSMRWR